MTTQATKSNISNRIPVRGRLGVLWLQTAVVLLFSHLHLGFESKVSCETDDLSGHAACKERLQSCWNAVDMLVLQLKYCSNRGL